MLPPLIAVKHALAAVLLVVYPAWDYFDARLLRSGTDSWEKLRYYQRTFGFEWIAAALAVWSMGPRLFLFPSGLPAFAAGHAAASRAAGHAIALLVMWLILRPHIRALRTPHVKEKLRRAVAGMQFFLPKTHQEARWFLALSVTAGICEEVLYRGFLIRYLGREPGRLGMIGGVLVALLAFGAAHLYQGVQGFLNSAIGGLLFAVVFLLTGNLVLPILFHIAADALLVPVVKE
jgi:membrane protease YdiL (CAAX protease family)